MTNHVRVICRSTCIVLLAVLSTTAFKAREHGPVVPTQYAFYDLASSNVHKTANQLGTFPKCAREPLRIDLFRDPSRREIRLPDNSEAKPWRNDTIVLTKFMDAEYYGLIKIGKPAKDYKMAFSSTWGDTWLPSEHCGLLEVACLMHTRYDSTKSSTYQPDGKPVAIKVGNDSLNGFISIDNFHLPHLPAVENQSFIEMTHMPNSYVLTKADGLIGLGFASLSTATVPLMYTLRKQNLIDKSIFTFYFNRDETTDKAGRLILGSTERKHVKVDTLTTLPVTSKTYWEVKMVRVVMDVKKKSYPFCIDGCSAILSTTSNLIYVPKSDIEKINDFLGARKFLPDYFQPNRYMVNCRDYAKLADMHFVFGHEQKNFTINSKYYIQKFRYESVIVCLSPFVDGDEGQWILGGAFLMQFYTEYDLDNARVVIGQTIF